MCKEQYLLRILLIVNFPRNGFLFHAFENGASVYVYISSLNYWPDQISIFNFHFFTACNNTSISYNKGSEYVCPTENKDNKPDPGFYTDCQDLGNPFYKSAKVNGNRPETNLYDSTYDNPEMYQSLNEYEDSFLKQQNPNKIVIAKPGHDYPNYPIDSIAVTNNTDSAPGYAALASVPDNIYATTDGRQSYPNYPKDPISISTENSEPGYAALSQVPENIYTPTAERRKSNDYTLLAEGQQSPDELQATYATLESNSDMYATLEEHGDSFNRKENTYQTLQDENNEVDNFSKYVGWWTKKPALDRG